MNACYIAGPMRGIDKWNFPAFHEAERRLKLYGIDVRNPARHDEEGGVNPSNYPILPPWFTVEDALSWDFQQIIETKNIVLLDGFEASSGAEKELRVAEDVGAKVWRLTDGRLEEFSYDIARFMRQASQAFTHSSPAMGKGDVTGVKWTSNPGPQAPVSIPSGEYEQKDPETGAKKNGKLARTDLLPTDVLLSLAEHYGRGAQKYADRNWEAGYPWSWSFSALVRHLFAWWSGEDLITDDPIFAGVSHLDAVVWHAVALRAFELRDIGTDDRPLLP